MPSDMTVMDTSSPNQDRYDSNEQERMEEVGVTDVQVMTDIEIPTPLTIPDSNSALKLQGVLPFGRPGGGGKMGDGGDGDGRGNLKGMLQGVFYDIKQTRDRRATEVMGDPNKISIADNGNIVLSEGVFFDLGSSALKQEGIAVLDELIDAFATFLSDEDTTRYVDSIVISGHTDSTGTETDNRQLSTDRANSVLNYLLGGKREKLGGYAPYFCAAGYGETRPVASNDTAEGRAQNRRIEISMILRDESVLEIVEQYLAIPVPESVAAAEDGQINGSASAARP